MLTNSKSSERVRVHLHVPGSSASQFAIQLSETDSRRGLKVSLQPPPRQGLANLFKTTRLSKVLDNFFVFSEEWPRYGQNRL